MAAIEGGFGFGEVLVELVWELVVSGLVVEAADASPDAVGVLVGVVGPALAFPSLLIVLVAALHLLHSLSG